MGWVLFSFHLQRSYSLVVFNECATLYLESKSSALRAIQRDEGWNCKGAHSATIAIPGLGE